MQVHTHAFVNSEITLIVEALTRAAKRQASESKWHEARNNDKLAREHGKKATAMFKLVNKLQPMAGLQGVVK